MITSATFSRNSQSKQPCWRVSNSSFFSLFSLFPRVLRVYSSGKDKSGIYNLLVAIEDIHLTISHHFGLDSGTINLPRGMSQASNLSSFCDGLKYLWPMQNRVLIAVLSVSRSGENWSCARTSACQGLPKGWRREILEKPPFPGSLV